MVNKYVEVTNNWVEAWEFHVVEQNIWQTKEKYYCKKQIQPVKYINMYFLFPEKQYSEGTGNCYVPVVLCPLFKASNGWPANFVL